MNSFRSHIHAVQSLEPLRGAGLGLSALQLHLSFQKQTQSSLITTRDKTFNPQWPGVYQGIRKGPLKAFFSPGLHAEITKNASSNSCFHGHGFYVYTDYLLGKTARRLGCPLIYHVQGCFDPWILARSKIKKSIAGWLFQNKNFAHCSLWRALTSKEEKQIRALGFRQPIIILPNGIDLKDTDTPPPDDACPEVHQKKRPKTLLFLSRLHPKKGLPLLLESWREIHFHFPDWELLIVGPDEDNHWKALEPNIALGKYGPSIRRFDAVHGHAKNAIFKAADAFALPSYSEGFPMVVLEAAAHKLPSLISTECNFPQLAEVGGAISCKPEFDDVKKALTQLLSLPDDERKEMGQRARQLIQEKYTWASISTTLLNVCESL